MIVFCLDWHRSGGSVVDLVEQPLQQHLDFDWRYWDGKNFTEIDALTSQSEALWFHQFLPDREVLQQLRRPALWTPMWDNVCNRSQAWWNQLPKNLRVVAFSNGVYERARRAGLETLRLNYHKDPASFEPVRWSQGRVLLYWNRTGLVGPEFLERLCSTLRIDKLLFRGSTDPEYVNLASYTLPEKLGNTTVINLPVFHTRQEYFDVAGEANVFIAPRATEGVGMAFLEALARGCAVFAHNRPTMNEYIVSKQTGWLFTRRWTFRRFGRAVRTLVARRGIGTPPSFRYILREQEQDWAQIASLDLHALGRASLKAQQHGYALWQSQLSSYLDFVQRSH